MGSLRTRFYGAIVAAVVASVILHVLAISSAQSSYSGDGSITQPSLVVPTVLTALASFCLWASGALLLGVVATFVVDEAFVRRYEIDAIAEGGSGPDTDAAPAYGSDPELL